MHQLHRDLDRYADLDSPLHRLDPRTKTLCLLVFAIAVVRTPPAALPKLGVYAGLLAALALVSRVPIGYLLRRAAAALPFLLFIALFTPFARVRDPLLLTGSFLAKASLSIVAVTVLMATTRFHRFLQGLERLRVPRALVLTLMFVHRYLFVLADEAAAMRRARESRLVGRLPVRAVVRSGAAMVGALFVRALERSERVAAAMASRGFEGEIRTLAELRFGRRDLVACAHFLPAAVAIAWLPW